MKFILESELGVVILIILVIYVGIRIAEFIMEEF